MEHEVVKCGMCIVKEMNVVKGSWRIEEGNWRIEEGSWRIKGAEHK